MVLVHILPGGFSPDDAEATISAGQRSHGRSRSTRPRDEGLIWMLQDLIVNRLPLIMVVAHVAGKRLHAADTYVNAHRLLDLIG
jgi:hypothetical protein